jgi:ribosomal protein S18 acetylase RimI-like enzyme
MKLYARAGFELGDGHYRLEMLGQDFHIDPGSAAVTCRTAAEVGLEAFYEAEARVGRWESVDQSRRDCETSRRMWCVDPQTDYLAAYDNDEVVGTARVAVTREGTGVLDALQVRPGRRGQGIGRVLIAAALSALENRTDVVWLDVDSDNTASRRLYESAGFRVHHEHGELSITLARHTDTAGRD